MELTVGKVVLITVVIVFVTIVYLWKTKHVFNYYAKLVYYFGDFMFGGLLAIPVVLLTPWTLFDPANIRPFQKWWNFSLKLIDIHFVKRNCDIMEKLDEPALLLVNHQSALDIIGTMQCAPYRATYLAKKEVFYAWPFGLAAWLCGMIFIDRLNATKAHGTMVKTARIITEQKVKLWVFPEGTRNTKNELKLLSFKKGAFHLAVQAQVPIYAVVFSSYRHFLDAKRSILNPGKVIASCLPPIPTKGLTNDDVNELTEKVHGLMEAEFIKISQEVEAEMKAQGKSLLKD